MCIKMMFQIFCLTASLRSHGCPAPFAYVLWQIIYLIVYVCVSALNVIVLQSVIILLLRCALTCVSPLYERLCYSHFFFFVSPCASVCLRFCTCICAVWSGVVSAYTIVIRSVSGIVVRCVSKWCSRYFGLWRHCGVTDGPLHSRIFYDRSFVWLCTCVCLLWSGIVISP